jgi:cation diffusion facilitator family transporter
MMDRALPRAAWVAVIAAILTIVLKGIGYWFTGSVAILSDAMESLVNLITSVIALVVLTIAARPADEEHAYGHSKAEYFASGFEGALILIAALSIGVASVTRLLDPVPFADVRRGLVVTLAATAVNLVAARLLLRAGRQHRSIALESGARHLMTDVWTSIGVVVGVGVAATTGELWLDPVIALVVAGNIVYTGFSLVRRSMLGLLDTALPEDTRREIISLLEGQKAKGVQYHALRTRQAGMWGFISVHILVPGEWTVQQGHDLLEEIEEELGDIVPNSTVFTHLEPLEDPLSFQDTELKRRR